MQNRKALTLLDMVVTIFIIMVLLVIFMSMQGRVKKIAPRVVCGTNLKGLGTAHVVYANDYDDAYAIQGRKGTPVWTTGTDEFFNPDKDWSKAKGITVGASLYLLVREADVSPKSFVCPSSEQTAFDGRNPLKTEITQMWDFGMFTTDRVKRRDYGVGKKHGPKNHVSYSYHMPYGPKGGAGRYAADGTKSAAFAVMADKNPWYDSALRPTPGINSQNYVNRVRHLSPYWANSAVQRWQIDSANTEPHDRSGQLVMYADGHASYEKTSDVGINHDNIYTRRGVGGGESDIRIGDTGEMDRYTVDNAWQPRDDQDSFLVNDDSRLPPYPVP